MSKAEIFIQENTKNCSNEIAHWDIGGENVKPIYALWLTPDQARRAVEIEREETYDKIWHWLAAHINDYVVVGKGRDIDLMFDDIKQAMKDETQNKRHTGRGRTHQA